jgi:hypothetical protein
VADQTIQMGDKLHIITRRQFAEDVRRHFVGEVTATSAGLVEVEGYAFVFNSAVNEYRRHPEVRRRVLSLGESGYIVNKIPLDVDLSAITYRLAAQGLVATDGRSFSLAINEFGPKH